MFAWWKKGEAVDSAIFAHPVPDLHMIRMRILGEARGLRLLRCEEPLLALSNLKEPPLSIAVIPWHDTILQLNHCFMQIVPLLRKPRQEHGFEHLDSRLWAI